MTPLPDDPGIAPEVLEAARTAFLAGDVADLDRSLAAAILAAFGAMRPVTWRWKPKTATLWIYNPEPEWLLSQDIATIDKEPLFTAPKGGSCHD